jgi:opacity protein-like surface antigen
MRRFAYVVAGCLWLSASIAVAQPVSSVVEGAGVKVGEGTVLHPVLGVETGIVHNVFYEENDPVISGLLRVIGEFAVGSLPAERMQAVPEQAENTRDYGDLAFRLEASLQYEEYLTSNQNAQDQRDLAVSALARGLVFPKRTWQFGFSDEFRRETRPVNYESSDNVDRDINRVTLQLRYRPKGRTLSGTLSYSNLIDYFEDSDQQFANRIQHTLALNVGWQWLPVTRIYGEVSQGFYRAFGDASTRPSSNPLRIEAGIASAITVKTSINAKIGMARAAYETGPGYFNVIGSLQLGYRFSPQATMAAMYQFDYQDSINANYYRDHAFLLRTDHRIDRFGFAAGAELRLRGYRGVIMEVMPTTPGTDRDDIIFSAMLGAVYNFKNWIAATLDYRFTTDQTDFTYIPGMGDPPDDPSYTRQTLMAGVRAAY